RPVESPAARVGSVVRPLGALPRPPGPSCRLPVHRAPGVAAEPLAVPAAPPGGLGLEVLGEDPPVLRAAVLVPDAVDLQTPGFQAEVLEVPLPARDDLDVGRRIGGADDLDVELPELAAPAGLRPAVAPHRAGEV